MGKWSNILKVIKVALKIEQKLEEVGIVPQNKIDDIVVELVNGQGRKENNSSNP